MLELEKKIRLLSILAIIAMMTIPLSLAVSNTDTNKNPVNSVQNNSVVDKTNGIKASGQVPQNVSKTPSPKSATVIDDFNRPNGPIGSKWTIQSGGFQILNNAAVGSGSTNLVTYNGVYSNAVEADVTSVGTDLEYVGLVLGDHDVNNNLFIKVQNQDGIPGFEWGACYVGNNGNSGTFGLGFFPLAAPFTTAHMRAELIGSTVYITFTNIDGTSNSQSYTCGSAPSTGGSGIGINSFTSISNIDNFAADEGAVANPSYLFVFARGSDNALWYRQYNAGTNAWSNWVSLGGIITADPESSYYSGNTFVFVRGSDNALWYRKFDGNSWSQWTSLGGILNGGVGSSATP